MKHLYILVFFLASIVNVTDAKNVGNYNQESFNYENALFKYDNAPPTISATIEGSTTVCQNANSPVITLKGTDGTAPYTFTYKINGGADIPVTTAGNDDKHTINVPTSVAGTFVYKLIKVTDADSNSQNVDVDATVTVNALPAVDFTFADNQCSGVGVQFTPTLTGSSYTYAWNFGDGTTSTDANPTHVYSSLGCGNVPYQITLTIMDVNGCQSYKTKTISIKQKPDIGFNDVNYPYDPFSNCSFASATNPNYTIKVGNNSASASCITSYSIDWGDGSPSTSLTFPATHTYTKLGAFNMSITAIGTNGCSNSISYVIKNVSNPSGGIISPGNTQNLCAPTSALQFQISNWGKNSPGTTYNINFGDGTVNTLTQEQMEATSYYLVSDPSNSPNYPIPHSYTTSNCPNSQFIATLTITNACGLTNGTTSSITILTKPDANFNIPTSACVNSSVLFTNTTISGYSQNCNKNATYTWDFGDGSSIVVTPLTLPQNIYHTYSNTGNYTIKLTVENYCGATSKTKLIVINPLPTGAILGTTNVCKNSASPLITFTGANGTAPYTFTCTINGGATKTIKTISGNSVSVSAPTTTPGTFTYSLVSVQESSTSACSQPQTGTAVVTVNPLPTATISGNASVCLNSTSPLITFTGAVGTAPYTFTYNINGGTNQTITTTTGNSVSIPVSINATGIFKYNLVSVQDASTTACTQAQTSSATITVNPIPAAMTLTDQEYCNGITTTTISFSNSVPGTTYSWVNSTPTIGLVSSGTGSIPPFVAKNNTSSPVVATITVTPSTNGCPGASQTFSMKVNPSAAVAFSTTNQTICSEESTTEVTLSSTTTGANFSWSAVQPSGITGMISSGTNTIPSQTLINSTNAPISVVYKAQANLSGATTCAGAEYDYVVTVNPRPFVQGPLKSVICNGTAFTFTPANGDGNVIPIGTKYSWASPVISPAGSITGASAQNNQTVISQTLENTTSEVATATYTVTATAGNGCSSQVFDVIVTVNPKPAVIMPSNITLCNHDVCSEILFTGNLIGTVYKWSSNNTSIGIASSGFDKILEFTAINTGTSPVTATIAVTPTHDNGGVSCDGAVEYFTITVNPTGQVNNPGSLEACSAVNNSINFITKNTGGNTTYSWTNSNPGIGISASGNGDILYTPVNSGLTDLSTSITVTPTFINNGVGCQGSAEQFSIVVHPTPTADQPYDQTVCNGFPTTDIKFSGNISATTYNWVIDNATIGLPANGTGDISKFMTINNSLNPIVATITVTPMLNGCSGVSKTFTITVKPSPSFTSQPKTTTICKDEPVVLSVSYRNSAVAPVYQWYSNTINSLTGASALSNTNAASYTPSSSTAGTMYYYCNLTFPTGDCNNLTSDIAAVIVNPYPVISQYSVRIGSGQVFNINPKTVNDDIVPIGTTYTWSTPVLTPASSITGATSQSTSQLSVSQTLTNVTHGIATVTYTVTPTSGVCKGADFKVVVTVNPPIDPNVVQKNVDCLGANNGSLATAVEGGIPFSTGDPYRVSWTGANAFFSSSPTITDLSPGVYNLSITDDGGLPFIMSYTITEPAGIHIETLRNKNISCFGAANGEIAISVSGGTPPYNYLWKKDGVSFSGFENISNLSPGNYEVSVTDVNNCNPQTLAYTITEPNLLVVNLIKKTDILCFGESTGTVSVSIVGGTKIEVTPGVFDYKYAWSGPNGYTSIDKDLTNIAAGLYKLVVTDNAGCTQNFSTTIDQPDEIKIDVKTTPVTCYGANNASINLTISGGVAPYKIQWAYASVGGEFQDNYAIGGFQDNLAVGNYKVTVVDANNCSKNIVINIPDAPIFRIMPVVKNVSCFGAKDGSITLNFEGGRKPISLVWSDNSTAGTARNNIGPGTYRVIISDGTPCVIDTTFVIIEPQLFVLSANLTHALDCNNANSGAINLMVSGGTPPYNCFWSNGMTTEDLNNIPAGNYLVTVTDANICVQTAQYAITRPAPIAISVSTVTNLNCETQQVSKISTANVTGGVPPYILTWSGGTVSGVNNEIMQTSQSSFVMLDVADALGCTSRYTFNVDIPALGISYQLVDCNTHHYQFNAVVPNDAETYTYSWDFGDGVGSTMKNPVHSFASPGNFTVKLIYESTTCTNKFSDVIAVESSPVLDLDKLPIFCAGDSILLHASGTDFYRWSNGSTGDSLLIKQAGDYSVLGTSKAGCTSTLNFKATNFEPLNYTIQSNKEEITTDDPSIQLWSESITYSDYFWDFGDGKSDQGNSQDHYYDNLRDGYYEVKLKVKNPNGCNEFAAKKIWTNNTSKNNVFTPNGDGIDDVFMKGWHIKVYNRNGILLYDNTTGWDGTYRGKPVSNDTYFYVLYETTVSGVKTDTGFITVVR